MKVEAMFDVRGKCGVVTGGGSGIGLAICEVLAEHGARVAILDINLPRAEAEAARLRALGQDVQAIACDVSDDRSVDAAIDRCAAEWGRIDFLFANAGIDPGSTVLGPDGKRSEAGALENYATDRWERIVDISLNGVFFCTRAAVRHMKPQRDGRIIITTSAAAERAMPIGIAYPAAKAAAAHFMRNAALELAKYNIKVNAIAPGPFITNIGDGFAHDANVQKGMAALIPLGRMADVEEMKGLALFLVSPTSSFMTGAHLFNDGGLSLGAPID